MKVPSVVPPRPLRLPQSRRFSCIGGVPCVRNAGVVRGVIHPATLFRVPRVRLRREEEDTVQRGMSAPRELPKALSVEMLPRPVRFKSQYIPTVRIPPPWGPRLQKFIHWEDGKAIQIHQIERGGPPSER